jgi:hypothetical protein
MIVLKKTTPNEIASVPYQFECKCVTINNVMSSLLSVPLNLGPNYTLRGCAVVSFSPTLLFFLPFEYLMDALQTFTYVPFNQINCSFSFFRHHQLIVEAGGRKIVNERKLKMSSR